MVLAVPVFAQSAPPRRADVADSVVAAVEKDDDAALREIVEREAFDLWSVAAELCARGAADAALRLAEATSSPSHARLAEYVRARREQPEPPSAHALLDEVDAKLRAGAAAEALRLLAEVRAEPASTFSEIQCVAVRGSTLMATGRPDLALPFLISASESAEEIGWLARARTARGLALQCVWHMGDAEAMVRHAEHMVAICVAMEDAALVANARIPLGIAYYRLGRHAEAEATWTASLGTVRELGIRHDEATLLLNLANVYQSTDRLELAVESYESAVEVGRAMGQPSNVATALTNGCTILIELNELEEARRRVDEALRLCESVDDPRTESLALWQRAVVQRVLGQYTDALATLRRSVDVARAAGMSLRAAKSLAALGDTYRRMGDYPRSVAALHDALAILEGAEPALAAYCRAALAECLAAGGRLDEAASQAERAAEAARSLPVSEMTTKVWLTAARVAGTVGDDARAEELLREVLARSGEQRLADRLRGAAMSDLASLLRGRGRFEEALALARDASVLMSHTPGAGLLGIAEVQMAMADVPAARATLDELEAALEETQDVNLRVKVAQMGAYAAWASGEHETSVRLALEAQDRLAVLFAAQTEDEGAALRSNWQGGLAPGVASATELGDLAGLTALLERSQAGTLLEALGGRERLQAVVLDPELQQRELEARAAETAALTRYRRQTGSLKERRAARQELDAARAARQEIVARIQRETRGAAGLVYPRASSIDEIQAALRGGEVFVHFAFLDGERGQARPLVALVIGSESARIVSLPGIEAARASAVALDELLAVPTSSPAEIETHLSALRRALIEPLGLGEDVKRVLVTAREFAMTPLGLVDATRELVYVPSGSTYVALCEDREKKGEGVLGLGDPDYSAKERETVVAANRAGRLLPLPGTRVEVEAVADVKLLGSDATEERLRAAVAKRARWRSIHLACHGLAPGGGGILSSLAISVGDTDDGNLTAQEILMLDASADLVALSACETGRGKNYAGEGVVGLPRAFMVAGASRVLCSLWKVDDQATRELMVKFYDEWKTKPAATALRNAQAHVRAQEKWSHPYFWAAWQLWGLPD